MFDAGRPDPEAPRALCAEVAAALGPPRPHLPSADGARVPRGSGSFRPAARGDDTGGPDDGTRWDGPGGEDRVGGDAQAWGVSRVRRAAGLGMARQIMPATSSYCILLHKPGYIACWTDVLGNIRQALSLGQGRAVQADPIKPTLKAPGPKRLKLEYEEALSNFVFNQLAPLHQGGRVPVGLADVSRGSCGRAPGRVAVGARAR